MSARVIVDIKEEPGEMISTAAETIITKFSTPKEIVIAKLVVAVVDSKFKEAAALDKQKEGGNK